MEKVEQEEETTPLVRKSRNENDSKINVEEVSNGVPQSNGHSDLAENGAKSEEQETEELQNKSETIIEEQKTENLVFYDKTEGIWKCRICTWIYQNQNQNGSVCVCVHHIQKPKLMNVKTLNFQSQGLESVASAYAEEKEIVKVPDDDELDASSSLDFVLPQGSTTTPAVNNGYEGILENDSKDYVYKSSKEIETVEVDADTVQGEEFDVETVLEKQTTHDLYCPNCNSCITKRVILRKRKRRVQASDEEVKRNKIVETDSTLVQSTSIDRDDDNQDEDERNISEPDVFRCFSCFSFFIPTRNGFRIFGNKGGNEEASTVKKNWFTSMFGSKGSNQMEVPIPEVGNLPSSNLGIQSDQPSISKEPRPLSRTGNNYNPESAVTTLPSPGQKHSLNGKVIPSSNLDAKTEQFDAYTKDESKESKSNINVESDPSVTSPPQRTLASNGISAADDAFTFYQPDGLKMLVSTDNESPAVESSDEDQISNQTIQSGDTDAMKSSTTSDSVFKASDVDGVLRFSVSIPHEDDQDVTATILTQSTENKQSNFTSKEGGQVHSTQVSQHIVTNTKYEVHSGDNYSTLKDAQLQQGKDTVINIDRQPYGSSQTLQDVIGSSETTSLLEPATQTSRQRSEERRELEIEVIKSVVYGGLAESITSLSIVSSAAGGGASTLNALALGVANLFGGLFIICHNLWELKSEHHVEQVANQVSMNQRDRYREVLGRRRNFILHSVLAIISYLVFGSVAPAVYGFSFRKSDDKQLKVMVTGAVSLVCIIVLAVGRAYVSRPPKPYLKIVVTFFVLGFMVSGVSYAAGELGERLLEKLGLFKSTGLPTFERASY